ncbi:MAG: VWA domain-containing protein, partial [Parvularculaceae bacterium]|nr:VWA domain-containing protein [Parvularculaceae bacterium]
ILLDRTGSMQGLWDEALSSINAYAENLGQPDASGKSVDARVTLAAFDAQEGLKFDILRRDVAPAAWKKITNDDATPRGMTPLFDAIGRIVSVAEQDSPEKAVIVIMTDGEENASTEMKKSDAKAALDRAQKRGWQVVFLGADFAKFADADAVGVSRAKQMAVSPGKMGDTMRLLGEKTKSYGQSSNYSVEFGAEDRAKAEEEKVKQKSQKQ